MSEPVASRVLDALGPGLAEQSGPLLPGIVEALTSATQDAADLTEPAGQPWPAAFDLDATPAPHWLATIVGTQIPYGLDAEAVRIYVRDRAAWRRGTPPAMLAAATDAYPHGLITFVERDGSPWRLTIRVYSAEATLDDQARILAAVSVHKPVGIVLSVDIVSGASYAHLSDEAASYISLAALFPTYDVMRAHVPEEGTVP